MRDRTSPPEVHLCGALADVAALDAHAARDVLHRDAEGSCPSAGQRREINTVLTAAGLGTGNLPPAHMQALTEAADEAEEALRDLL
ncbi:hypothetical protein GCM10010129_07920 [Streptomyces fumigatiscleroticus]|nr:hypothetical protein GCM10010129_07920 [Streptomyces fumigatiscleroticus]